MGIELFIVALLAFMLLAALIAVETNDLLSAVIAVGAAGFGLSVVDLMLGAPDLAITQVVVEVIALVLLIRVVLTRKDTSEVQHRDALRTGLSLLAGGVLLVVAFFAFGGAGVQDAMPRFGEPVLAGSASGVSADYLSNALNQTGAANVVMAVLLDYRAYDTLGEATVIFVSILGAYAILRKIGRKGEQDAEVLGKEIEGS